MASKPRGKLLASEPKTVEPKKPKVLVYGPPGAGKTWVSLDWPRVYYIDTERGADLDHYQDKLKSAGGVYMGPDDGSLDFDVVTDQMQLLATQEHPYKTVVLDSASKLWNSALSEEQDRLGDKDAFGAYKKAPTRKFNTMLRWLNRLDMNGIIICHQKELWGISDKGQREAVGYTFDCQDKLAYDLHLVLRIGERRGKGPSRAYIGKSRLPAFPEGDNFEWTYEEFASRWGRDVIEQKAKAIEIASDEQVAEVSRLLETVKVADDWTEKCFKKAGVENWGEMEADQIGKVIDALKAKLAA